MSITERCPHIGHGTLDETRPRSCGIFPKSRNKVERHATGPCPASEVPPEQVMVDNNNTSQPTIQVGCAE